MDFDYTRGHPAIYMVNVRRNSETDRYLVDTKKRATEIFNGMSQNEDGWFREVSMYDLRKNKCIEFIRFDVRKE